MSVTSQRNFPSRLQETAACLLFFILSIAYFWPIFFQDKALCPVNPLTLSPWDENIPESEIRPGSSNPLMMDAITLIYPWREFNHRMFHQGHMPLWNPYVYCGIPHLAQIQPGSTDPLVMPFDWFDPVRGVGYSMALHMALAGLFFYLFLRRIDFPIGPALIGGILFEFNGMFLVKMGNPTFINSAAWTGMMLFGIEGVLGTGRWKSALPIVIAIYLSSVGGHPQLAAISYLVGISYLAFRLFQTPNHRGRAIKLFLGASAAGGALAAYQLLPFLELLRNTSRVKIAFDVYRSTASPVAAGIQAIFPDFFGNPVDHNWWFREISNLIKPQDVSLGIWTANYTEQNLYMGVFPLVLSAYGCWKRRTALTLFFLALALSALAIFFGTPLLTFAYYVLPAFGQARLDRIVYLYLVCIAALSAIGALSVGEEKPRDPEDKNYGRKMLYCCGAFLILMAFPFLSTISGYGAWIPLAWKMLQEKVSGWQAQFGISIAVLVLGILFVWLAEKQKIQKRTFFCAGVALILFQLFPFGWRFNPVQDIPLFPKTDLNDIVRDDQQLNRVVRIIVRGGMRFFVSNVPQTLGLFDANGASSVPAGEFAQFIRALDAHAIQLDIHFFDFSDRRLFSRKILDYLNAEFVISDVSLPLPELKTYKNGLFHVYRNPDFMQRFFLVNQVEFYEEKENALQRVAQKQFDPSKTVLIRKGDADARSTTPGDSAGSVRVVSYEPQRIELQTDSASGAVLVSSEVFYPGWKTYLDGSAVKTIEVNTAFRGAIVPAGHHSVRFEFDPDSFRYGVIISIVALMGIFFSILLSIRRSKKTWQAIPDQSSV